MKEALYWEKAANGRITCRLCPHRCAIAEGKTGRCGVRAAKDNVLWAAGYGRISAAHSDPIEKKPLYHFAPGRDIFSIGGWGCNFTCEFCQNWSISQRVQLNGAEYSPAQLVEAARNSNSVGMAYTYNEPLINIEFVLDCSAAVRKAGMANVLVTNGYIEPEPAEELLKLTDAMNIDVKSMDDAFYRRHCRGSLAPVLNFAVMARRAGRHVEITNLVIPGLNDNDEQVSALAKWVEENIGKETPLHLSAYRPEYKMKIGNTPAQTLERARRICAERLRYVYIGNAFTEDGQNTLCPHCGATLIERRGYAVSITGVNKSACASCGKHADIVVPD